MGPTHYRHFTILYILVALLVVGLGVVLYKLEFAGGANGFAHSSAVMRTSPTGIEIASSTVDLAKIVVGGGGAVGAAYAGTITALNANSISIKNADGALQTLSVTSATKFQIGGKLKDPATIQQELAVYNAKVAELMKDPEKNKDALAAMQIPSPQIITAATASDFAVGDQVVVTADAHNATAAVISKTVTTQ